MKYYGKYIDGGEAAAQSLTKLNHVLFSLVQGDRVTQLTKRTVVLLKVERSVMIAALFMGVTRRTNGRYIGEFSTSPSEPGIVSACIRSLLTCSTAQNYFFAR